MEEKWQKQLLQTQELILKVAGNKQQNIEKEATFSQDAVWNTIETFNYSLEEDKNFEDYFRRYEDIYNIDCQNWTEAKKL